MSILTWIVGAAEGMAEAVANGLATLLSFVIDFNIAMALAMLDFLPSVSWPITAADSESLMSRIGAWNAFVPIYEGFALLAFFLLFSFTFAVVKISIRRFPGQS